MERQQQSTVYCPACEDWARQTCVASGHIIPLDGHIVPPGKRQRGCHNNFYNGNNDLGVKECWSFPSATMVRKLDIPVGMRPPYKHIKPTLRPSCYKRQREVRVDPASLDTAGFWKR